MIHKKYANKPYKSSQNTHTKNKDQSKTQNKKHTKLIGPSIQSQCNNSVLFRCHYYE